MTKSFSNLVLLVLILIWVFSVFSAYFYPTTFERAVIEDGFIENLTVITLLAGMLLMGFRLIKLWKSKNWKWRILNTGIFAFLVFGFGEEISWGMRIFNIDSTGFFYDHNTQGEINIHNLVLGGYRLNFIISQVFIVILSIYLLVFPYLYHKKEKFRLFADEIGLPIPTLRQIIIMLLSIIIMVVILHSQKWEILEISLALSGLIILIQPLNCQKIYSIGK